MRTSTGTNHWELDALDPRTITELIEKHVGELTDKSQRDKRIELQEEHREKLQAIADNYEELDI